MNYELLTVFGSIFALIFGASVGSFLNVVIYRIPAGLSIVSPPSHCPKCSHQLGPTENVPVLGWLWLGGRCRWCKTPISIRYPLIEAITACLFIFVFWRFTFSVTTLGYWVFLSWLLVLALIDIDTMTLPNVLTKWGLITGLGYQMVRGGQDIHQIIPHLIFGVGGAVLGIWLLDLIRWMGNYVYGQEAMGGGDPKLAGMIGAWLGWKLVLVSAFLACAVGAIFGIVAMIAGQLGRRQAMPFGPFLALGAALTVFWGDQIISSYTRLFFPLY